MVGSPKESKYLVKKERIFLLCKITNHYKLKLYYKVYFLILTKVIRNARMLYNNSIILQSKNKMKSTWKIIDNERGVTHQDTSAPLLKLDEKLIAKQHKIAKFLIATTHLHLSLLSVTGIKRLFQL